MNVLYNQLSFALLNSSAQNEVTEVNYDTNPIRNKIQQ